MCFLLKHEFRCKDIIIGPGTRDGGIDIDFKDKNKQRCVAQCKRHAGPIERKTMCEFYGAQDARAKKLDLSGQNPRLELYFFTTSRFTAGAQGYAAEQGIKMYDESKLTTLVAKHSVSLMMEFVRHNLPLSTVHGLYRVTPLADTHNNVDHTGKKIQTNREDAALLSDDANLSVESSSEKAPNDVQVAPSEHPVFDQFPVKEFINCRCNTQDPLSRTSTRNLFNAYLAWCCEQGYVKKLGQSVSIVCFSNKLKATGFIRYRTNTDRGYYGVVLKDVPQPITIQHRTTDSVKRHIEHVLPDAKKAKQTTLLDNDQINNAFSDDSQKNASAKIDNDFIVATVDNVAETPTLVSNASTASYLSSNSITLLPPTVAGAVSALFAATNLCDQSRSDINQSTYWETRNTLLSMDEPKLAKFIAKNWPQAMQASKLDIILQCAVAARSIIKAPRDKINQRGTDVRCTLSYKVDFLTRLSLGNGVLDKCDGSMSLERAIITGLTNPSVALLQSIPHSIFIEALRFCISEWQKNQI